MTRAKGVNNPLVKAAISGSIAQRYASNVIATAPIAYWKLDEGSGSTIIDSSGNGYNGSYTGVTWDGTKFLNESVPLFDGVNDTGNVFSAGLASAFDFDEGAVLIWLKVADSGVWTDATFRTAVRFAVDTNNEYYIRRQTTNNQMIAVRKGNSITDIEFFNSLTTTDWFSLMMSWSSTNNQTLYYLNGSLTETDVFSAAVIGSLTDATIGHFSSQYWSGYLSQVVVWDSPADAAKIALMTV